MGGILSYLFSWVAAPAADTTPDPATGLSERDRMLIKKSWANVSDPKTLKPNGVEFFVQLFTKFPHMQLYFNSFREMDKEQLRHSPKVKAHALGVMYLLTSYVENMDDPETLVCLVEKLTTSHVNRNISHKDFEDLASMFVPFLKSLLGEEVVTSEMEEAWTKLLSAQNGIYAAVEKKIKSKQ